MTESFLATQSRIVESPEPRWERWTIDEIDEGIVRLLVSVARDAREIRRFARGLLEVRAEPRRDRGISELLRTEAMRLELAPADQQWSDEVATFVVEARLETFLRARKGKPGLPKNRPLREGDVFWIIVPDGAAFDVAFGQSMAGTEFIASYMTAQADVLDITAAARQAAKRSYHLALRTAGAVLADQRAEGGNG